MAKVGFFGFGEGEGVVVVVERVRVRVGREGVGRFGEEGGGGGVEGEAFH